MDYFAKLNRSLQQLAPTLKRSGKAIFVVQDSYYKDLHNDLSSFITDMAEAHGLALRRREDFPLQRSMSRINRYSRRYHRSSTTLESVLCFSKT
jgi:hypothetical protein